MMQTWIGPVVAALILAAPGLVMAHDTFIVPVTALGTQPLRLQVTSSGFFPEPESAIRPARVERIVARLGSAELSTHLSAGDVAMAVQVGLPSITDGNRTDLVVAIDLGAWDIDVGADETAHYMDEIGASPELKASVASAVARDGVLKETYAKHLKTLTCLAPCHAPGFAQPVGSALEFVSAPGGFRLLENGASSPGRAVFLTNETTGRQPLTTDPDGLVVLPSGVAGPTFLSAVILTPPTAPGGRFTSAWASLTFDAAILPR